MNYEPMPVYRLRSLIGMALSLICVLAGGCHMGGQGQNSVGVQLYQQGRYPEALQQFETAKKTDPGNPDTYYNLASTYHRMGVNQKDSKLIEQSEALYNQCLDLSPNHTACYRGLSVLLVETDRSDKAFTLLKNWTKQSPTLPDARIELAKLHQEFNQTKVAEQYLDEALSMDPNNAVAWAAKGRLREATGDLAQARQNYAQSLTLNALQPEVYQRVAALDMRLSQQAIQNAVVGTQTTIANGAGTATAAGNMTSQLPNATPPRY